MEIILKILLVEDSKIISFQVQSLLKQLGYEEIDVAEDGQVAWGLLLASEKNKIKYDLVLSDWFMPNLNGLELLNKVRDSKFLGKTFFLMMTTNSDIKAVVKVLEAGVDGYLVKPLTASKLGEALARVNDGQMAADTRSQFFEVEFTDIGESTASMQTENSKSSEVVHKLNEVLKGETEFLSSIIHAMNDLLIVIDSDERITRINDKVTDYLGLSKHKICSRCLSDFLVLYNESGFFDFQLNNVKEFTEVRGWLVDKNKEKVPVLVSGSQLLEKEGEVIGLVLCVKDVRNERRLQARVFELDKWKSIGELASGVAHEVNNPLGVIKGYIEQLAIMEGQAVKNKEKKLVIFERVIKMVERIAKIVSGLKTLSRDGNSDGFEEIVIRSCIDEAITIYNEKLRNLEVEVEFINSIGEERIYCQPTQIFQVILNLLMNACDAVQDLPEKWIKLEVKKKNNMIELSVTDSGSGIAKDKLNRVFEPFYTSKDPNKGTGLGLSISRTIAHAHNGDLIVDESSVNTSFVLKLHRDIMHIKGAA